LKSHIRVLLGKSEVEITEVVERVGQVQFRSCFVRASHSKEARMLTVGRGICLQLNLTDIARSK
jgi:hypothetical protein